MGVSAKEKCKKKRTDFLVPFQVMRAPRDHIRSRVLLSQYPRNVDAVPYVGYSPTAYGSTKAFCVDVYLGSQQAGENVQSVRTLCSFKVRAEGAFFMTLVWEGLHGFIG